MGFSGFRVETLKSPTPRLTARTLRSSSLGSIHGIPRVHYKGRQGDYYVMVRPPSWRTAGWRASRAACDTLTLRLYRQNHVDFAAFRGIPAGVTASTLVQDVTRVLSCAVHGLWSIQ